MPTKITINNNGSLKIEGDFTIEDRTGNKYDLAGREVIGLCRCGLSKNKPFCDGAHNGNFTHEATSFACWFICTFRIKYKFVFHFILLLIYNNKNQF